MGDKIFGDLIDDVDLEVIGTDVKVSGTLKTIKEPWTEFDSGGDNTGHFLPVKLPVSLVNQDVKIIGKENESTVHIDADRLLIMRLENFTGTTAEIKHNEKTVLKLDFSGVIPIGKKAWDSQKKDFGRYGKMEEYVSDLQLTWNGAKGTAKGKLLNYKASEHSENELAKTDGHFFPLALSDWYDGVDKTFGINNNKTDDAKDIIFTVTATDKPIKVVYNGLTVMEIDLTGMELVQASEAA